MKALKIVAISDVHGKWKKLKIPECDLLISTGDYSFEGEPHMTKDFHKWLNKQLTYVKEHYTLACVGEKSV